MIQEPDAGYSPIIGLISGAARSVRITVHELTDPAAVNALIDAHRRGVDTKVILDAAFHGHDTNAETIQQLAEAGVDVRWAPNGVIYHQKTITVDDTTAAVGTGNLTPKYYATSRDAWVLDSNPTDVAAITATFDTDWTTAASGRPPEATDAPDLIWSPAARVTFLQHIDQATDSVDVTSEELKDRAVLSALDNAARRGVTCRIVLTASPAWANAVAEVSGAGCSVHLLPDTKTALYMHEKFCSPTTARSSSAAKTSRRQVFSKTANCPLRSTPRPRQTLLPPWNPPSTPTTRPHPPLSGQLGVGPRRIS